VKQVRSLTAALDLLTKGNIMKLFIIAASFIAAAIAARAADAADKPAKPVVCESFDLVRSDLAVCSDGKKPFLMRQFTRVRVGETVVLVGFR
jgi:hypothetical protein